MNGVAKNIKHLRMLCNMTQDQLAERMSVTRQAVSEQLGNRKNTA